MFLVVAGYFSSFPLETLEKGKPKPLLGNQKPFEEFGFWIPDFEIPDSQDSQDSLDSGIQR